MSKKRNKTVPKAKQIKNRVPDAKGYQKEETRAYFTFIYSNWLQSFKNKDFTTFLRDESMYGFQMTYLFSYLIPKISEHWQSKLTNAEFKHCHKVKQSDKSYNKYIQTIKSLHPTIDTKALDIWQFGFKINPMRIICHKENGSNNFIPLLIDQHHLGNVDKNYNEADYGTYKFCPLLNYKK